MQLTHTLSDWIFFDDNFWKRCRYRSLTLFEFQIRHYRSAKSFLFFIAFIDLMSSIANILIVRWLRPLYLCISKEINHLIYINKYCFFNKIHMIVAVSSFLSVSQRTSCSMKEIHIHNILLSNYF